MEGIQHGKPGRAAEISDLTDCAYEESLVLTRLDTSVPQP